MQLLFASQSLWPYGIVMAVGFVIGTFGHIIKSRTMILTGVVVVAMGSCYFAFVVLKIT